MRYMKNVGLMELECIEMQIEWSLNVLRCRLDGV